MSINDRLCDGLGLGHFRITTAVAEGLARQVPKAARLLLTALPAAADFAIPETLDYVRMPGLDKPKLFAADPEREPGAPASVFSLRTRLIKATVDGFAPHLIVVDHDPAGLAGELLPVLQHRYRKRPRPLFVLGLRDITYGPERTDREWARNGSRELIEQVYDAILIYGSPLVFDPILEYTLSPAVAAKTTFTGYFRRPEPQRPIAEIRHELRATDAPLLVVSAGGGKDGAALMGAFIAAMEQGLLTGFAALAVAGPQMPLADLDCLAARAAPIPHLTFVRFRADLDSLIAAADVVVIMGGYNSVWEAVGTGQRPIIVPRRGGSDEQPLRAERWQALGLASLLPPATLTPEILAAAITVELARPTLSPGTLPFDGIDRAGEALERILKGK